MLAILLPNPVLVIPTPITRPLKTNQKAVVANPEKITCGGDTENSMATKKKNIAVKCSERIPVAHKLITIITSAAAWDSLGERDAGVFGQTGIIRHFFIFLLRLLRK